MLKPHAQMIMKEAFKSELPDVRLQLLLNISDYLSTEEARLSALANSSQNKGKLTYITLSIPLPFEHSDCFYSQSSARKC